MGKNKQNDYCDFLKLINLKRNNFKIEDPYEIDIDEKIFLCKSSSKHIYNY